MGFRIFADEETAPSLSRPQSTPPAPPDTPQPLEPVPVSAER